MLSPQSVAAPFGKRKRRLKGRHDVVCRLNCDTCLSSLRTKLLSSKGLYKIIHVTFTFTNKKSGDEFGKIMEKHPKVGN